jgi:hypothetical protein
MKMIKDNSLTPIELARLKYRKLYEEQIIFRSNVSEKMYITHILKNYWDSVKTIFFI